ncbi:NAD(P)-dependent alcohol dehydrogenase [Streptomyces sp. NPDC058335]|uniref:NAD(P)-dependent alcohol dehydrogenase n=1 Tax=Streptomyces sp. NPDC058335 TaxID=3346451 RepID=UPI00364F7474
MTRAIAAVVNEVGGAFRLEDLELADPGPGEALIRIVATGVCHTDAIARDGDLPMPYPGVLGHEGAGIVEAIGEGVTSVGPGDHVVIGWPSCGSCRNCRDGEPRYCARLGEALCSGARLLGPHAGDPSLRRSDGSAVHSHFFGQSSFASYSLTWADSLVKVPADVPVELLGPLACGVATGAGTVFNTLKPRPGSSLVVYGAGAVGLAAIMAARLSPATRIVAVDRHGSRLELATRYGATHTVQVGGDVDPVTAVHEICGGPADYSLECTGVVTVVRQAIDSVGMLGTCVLVGGAPAGAEFAADHLSTLWGKRIVGTLGGSGRSEELIGTLVELYRQGRFPFDELIRSYDLREIDAAFAASSSGDVLKPVLRMPH